MMANEYNTRRGYFISLKNIIQQSDHVIGLLNNQLMCLSLGSSPAFG